VFRRTCMPCAFLLCANWHARAVRRAPGLPCALNFEEAGSYPATRRKASEMRSQFCIRILHTVVPANAGNHSHRRVFCKGVCVLLPSIDHAVWIPRSRGRQPVFGS